MQAIVHFLCHNRSFLVGGGPGHDSITRDDLTLCAILDFCAFFGGSAVCSRYSTSISPQTLLINWFATRHLSAGSASDVNVVKCRDSLAGSSMADRIACPTCPVWSR